MRTSETAEAACRRPSTNMPELKKWEDKTHYEAKDALSWLAEERAWIINKKNEPEQDILKCEYVESLMSLDTAQYVVSPFAATRILTEVQGII